MYRWISPYDHLSLWAESLLLYRAHYRELPPRHPEPNILLLVRMGARIRLRIPDLQAQHLRLLGELLILPSGFRVIRPMHLQRGLHLGLLHRSVRAELLRLELS